MDQGKPGIDTIIELAQGRLSVDESLRLIESLEGDPDASRDFELVIDLFNLAAEGRDNVFQPEAEPRLPMWRRFVWRVEEACNANPVLYPATPLFISALTLCAVVIINAVHANPYEELVGIDRTAFEWNVRGPGEGDVAKAYHLYSVGSYDKAAEHLERYLRANPDGNLAQYVHYSLGVVYLLNSRETLLLLFPRRNSRLVESGLTQLAFALKHSGNKRLREESHFLRAKGFLMLEQQEAAIEELDSVVVLKGSRMSEANQVIERIKNIER